MTGDMLSFLLLLLALVELGAFSIGALIVLDRNLKQQQPHQDVPLMLPLEDLMGMKRNHTKPNKPENDQENQGNYL